MEAELLSVGDILMLSQVAWRIGRAFRNGAKSGPADLAAVERNADGLSEALKLLAETLHTDGVTLMAADDNTKIAIQTILLSAKVILDDLESFVDRYQIIRKKETAGGFMVERTWSDVVLANFNKLKWTTGGGDVTELKDILQVHASAINLTMQALQSHSLARLESTVIPIAKNISNQDPYDTDHSSHKLQNLLREIDTVIASVPGTKDHEVSADDAIALEKLAELSLRATPTALPSILSSTRLPVALDSRPRVSTNNKGTERLLSFGTGPSQHTSTGPASISAIESTSYQLRDDRYGSISSSAISHRRSQSADCTFEDSVTADSPIDSRGRVSKVADSPIHCSSDHILARSDTARRESTTLPRPNTDFIFDREQGTFYTPSTSSPHASPRESSKSFSRRQSKATLPPPAISAGSLHITSVPATPGTLLGKSLDRDGLQTLQDNPPRPSSRYPGTPEADKRKTPLNTFGPGLESSQFEKDLFRNSAILCDVRGKLIEIANFLPDEPDPRYNTEMRPICQDARICVIRKRENREHGGFRIATSVWALSENGQVRMQQRLSDVHETVPYCSYFQAEKVSLQPTEGDIVVRMHSAHWGASPTEEKRTTWINYIFHGESDAMAFQSAVYGRMLIGAYHTTKTTVIHEGIKGAFAFEEQFANIEMLRLWEDDGVSTPGATGGVLALMHISSSFGDGWARWWINNNQQHLRVKEDSNPRVAKVRGLNITVVRPGMSGRVERARTLPTQSDSLVQIDTTSIRGIAKDPGKRMPVKRVNGVRIEFSTEEERDAFVAMCKRCQTTMLPLPEL